MRKGKEFHRLVIGYASLFALSCAFKIALVVNENVFGTVLSNNVKMCSVLCCAACIIPEAVTERARKKILCTHSKNFAKSYICWSYHPSFVLPFTQYFTAYMLFFVLCMRTWCFTARSTQKFSALGRYLSVPLSSRKLCCVSFPRRVVRFVLFFLDKNIEGRCL